MGGSEDDQLMKRRICKMPKRYFALKARVMDVRWNSYDIWLELIEDKRFNGRKVTAKLNLYHRYNCHSCRFGDVIAYKVSISRPKSLRCRKQGMVKALDQRKRRVSENTYTWPWRYLPSSWALHRRTSLAKNANQDYISKWKLVCTECSHHYGDVITIVAVPMITYLTFMHVWSRASASRIKYQQRATGD